MRCSWCSLQHAWIQKLYLGGIQGIFKFPGGNWGIFSEILLFKFKEFEFSKGKGSPDPAPCDPPHDLLMCSLFKMTASFFMSHLKGEGGVNISIRLCIALINHTFHMKCSIFPIWNVNKGNKGENYNFIQIETYTGIFQHLFFLHVYVQCILIQRITKEIHLFLLYYIG